MANLKQISKETAVIIYFIAVLICLLITFFGCSSAPNTIIREVPIYIEKPALIDTVTLTDTVIVGDSVWYGQVKDSLGLVIGDLKIYFQKKIAELKLNAKIDTVYYPDTVEVNNASNSILPMVVNSFEWWEKTILFGGLGLIISFLTYLRIKRGKII